VTEILETENLVQSSGRRPGWRRFDYLTVAVRLAVLFLVLLLWQVSAGGPKSFLPEIVVSKPTTIWIKFWQLIFDGQLFRALGSTGLSVIYAILIGAAIGIALAALTAVPVGRWLLEPLVTVTYAIPKVGLIPLYIILLGLNARAHVALVTSATLFVYYFSARQALEEVDRNQLVALRLMGAGPIKVSTALYLQSAIPQLLTATRIALPLAFATEIFAELQVPAASGLGVLMDNFSQAGLQSLDSSGVVAVIVFVVLVAYLLDVVLGGWLRSYTARVGMLRSDGAA
jgi:NitT/TauT family transport system permease protein